ncbi:MAG: hypothetical protein JSR30_00245 [Proteobacteria bacterium]|nr:hypothetical protein [Pseudomonadota bacterium]
MAELLEMIERRAPMLMRQGGGALSKEMRGRRVTDEARDRIRALYLAGQTYRQIESETGYNSRIIRLATIGVQRTSHHAA